MRLRFDYEPAASTAKAQRAKAAGILTWAYRLAVAATAIVLGVLFVAWMVALVWSSL